MTNSSLISLFVLQHCSFTMLSCCALFMLPFWRGAMVVKYATKAKRVKHEKNNSSQPKQEQTPPLGSYLVRLDSTGTSILCHSFLKANTRTRTGKRFCKMFSESSIVVLPLPSCPRKLGELSKIVYETSYPRNGPS